MDSRRFMIIDTSKIGSPDMFITTKVSRLNIDGGMWCLTFSTSPTVYTYRYERVKFFTKPELIDIEHHGVYMRNKCVGGICELYRFGDDNHFYYHALFSDGSEADFDGKDIYVSRTTLDECGGGVWKYLQHLADETGLILENVGNVLVMQYRIVDRQRDNVPLAQYIGGKTKLKKYASPKQIIFPFGCNASQKIAVECALTNQVSIIQGPPGTGKTQTILNIIANLIIEGKSVLVVSNNNSAVENVAEKLSEENVGLGFLVAHLGSRENKTAFIENQPLVPNLSEWELFRKGEIAKELKDKLEIVSRGFKKQTTLAKLKIELEALRTENQYDQMHLNNSFLAQEWLQRKCSKKLLALKCHYETMVDRNKSLNLIFFVRWVWRLGFKILTLLHRPHKEIIFSLESAYYASRISEIETEIRSCESFLKSIDVNQNMRALRDLSLQILKHKIASKRIKMKRPHFSVNDIKSRSEEFLKEYPVVLSTTYAVKNCISKDMAFDYVIMDEASQVDIATGALALSCAMNAVIVGDDKQLPNVVDDKIRMVLSTLEQFYRIEDKYCSSTHSFLQSCSEVFVDAPQTLLREHYRCHPKIIEFCNQRFYDGQLITMTQDQGEKNVLSVIRTVKGQHARGHFNQREIDVIKQEVIPSLSSSESVGIITPYRKQAEEINYQLATEIASTVHKYQGRECSQIVMSMVDNEISSFSDDPNLLNVAISRAKDGLTIVLTSHDLEENSNMAQLIAYANYNNFQVTESRIRSVFDLLYKQYTEERLAFEKSMNIDLGEWSENLIYATLQEAIKQLKWQNIDVISHYPLSRLVVEEIILTKEENDFIENPLSHLDFLLYNTLTKKIFLAIEVDGWYYHQMEVQRKRDKIKDGVIEKLGLRMLRLSTMQTMTTDSIALIIKNLMI